MGEEVGRWEVGDCMCVCVLRVCVCVVPPLKIRPLLVCKRRQSRKEEVGQKKKLSAGRS